MKSYFLRLLDYDRYTNNQIIELLPGCDNPEKIVKIIAHMLAAQQVWLTRLKKLPPTGVPIWPDWTAERFEALTAENHKEFSTYINSLQEDDFEQTIAYQDSKGNPFENKLSDILCHVFNHGTHHRAQIGQYLKQSGIDLPVTDYIFYLRSANFSQ
ncbi:DinB family protein [Mucilaginibacter segetis]|uniref:DinB family protein n=1 Tax=Mucilaginibacter segetis TaxID=2793071 RepID=A0A934UPI8_9SPHI|nr:DinB family protein [Mucilaginibacter segetis]MBK0381160.1 DinB family protein [Mucilaginibacter segetis]